MADKTEERVRISLTRTQLRLVAWLLRHYADYLSGDDRPDHGWARLKELRAYSVEMKREWYLLAGRVNYLARRQSRKKEG